MQLIGLLEMLPVFAAKMAFADFLTYASPCGFIDNEGARANLIDGCSPDIDTGNMLSINARFDAELGCLGGLEYRLLEIQLTRPPDWTFQHCPNMATFSSGMRRTFRSIGQVSATVCLPLTKKQHEHSCHVHARTHAHTQNSYGRCDASSYCHFGIGCG